MNKVFENYRYHPTLQYDSLKLVFRVEERVLSIIDRVVRQIIPKAICRTNLGDPYRDLIRLEFVFADNADDEYGECIDFSPEDEAELRELLAESFA